MDPLISGTVDLPDLQGKRVTVMGLGRFGGGVAAVQFLCRQGARVTVTDLAPECELAESLAELDGLPLATLRLGGHEEQDFCEADLVLANPAVPRSNPYLELARRLNVPLTSEMNLFWQFNRGRTLGVTGSNGKSTTAALIHSILQAAGLRSWLGGNIGRSLLSVVDEIQAGDWVVLELSSFQLEDLNRLPASPEVAVITNFNANHLDWHGSLDAYRQAKQTILRWQPPQATAVLNRNDPEVSRWSCYGRQLWFGSSRPDRDGDGEFPLPLSDWLKLPGRHNFLNAQAAACAAMAVGADAAAVQQGLETFTPLPHRLQFVAEVAGRRFYNDSLATTPESAAAALDAFAEPVVLLAGGSDKQVDLTSMSKAIAEKTKAVALMGQTAEMLGCLLETEPSVPPPARRECASFEAAFHWAVEQSVPGDIVLLSPGCASYDWFRNFAERGERFMELVHGWQRHRQSRSCLSRHGDAEERGE